jgi:hypothetical protein
MEAGRTSQVVLFAMFLVKKRTGSEKARSSIARIQSKGITKRGRVYQKASFPDEIKLAVTGADPLQVRASQFADRLVGSGIGTVNRFADKHLANAPVARKVVRSVAKGIGVGTAGLRLAHRVINPFFVPRMLAKKALGLGATLPGEKYIGPGNPLNLGKPNSSGDEAAYQHDLDYDAMLKKGMSEKDVYFNFSNADQRLMNRADVTTPGGLAAYLGMGAKKVFLPRINEDNY